MVSAKERAAGPLLSAAVLQNFFFVRGVLPFVLAQMEKSTASPTNNRRKFERGKSSSSARDISTPEVSKSVTRQKSRRSTGQPTLTLLTRRDSLQKYLDRTSTAADNFRIEEAKWLSEDALGFAPMTKVTDRSSTTRGSESEIDEHDELMDEIQVHTINDADIFGINYLDAGDNTETIETKEDNDSECGPSSNQSRRTLRSKTSCMLDSDDDEGNANDEGTTQAFTETKTGQAQTKTNSIAPIVKLKFKETGDQAAKKKIYHNFHHLLTNQNASLYRKKNTVRAFQTNSPVRFEKEWGVNEGKKGDWVVWSGEGDMYCIQNEEFLANYVAAHRIHSDASEDDHQYIKNIKVLARRIGYCFTLPHAKKGEMTHGKKGDYIIQPEKGTLEDQYIMLSHQFHNKYQVVGSFSEYTELLKGVIMVSPSKELKRANSSCGDHNMHVSAERYKVATLNFMTEQAKKILRGSKGSHGDSSSTNAQDLGEGNSTNLKLKGKHTESQLPVVEPFGTTEELGVGSWDFDLFQLHKETRHWPLFHLAHHLLFERTNLVTTLGIDPDTINDFLAEIDDTYLPVAYHNNMHGADVLHGCNFMVEQTQLKECITPVEHFSFLIAGMCHDLSHPGKLCTRFLVLYSFIVSTKTLCVFFY